MEGVSRETARVRALALLYIGGCWRAWDAVCIYSWFVPSASMLVLKMKVECK